MPVPVFVIVFVFVVSVLYNVLKERLGAMSEALRVVQERTAGLWSWGFIRLLLLCDAGCW